MKSITLYPLIAVLAVTALLSLPLNAQSQIGTENRTIQFQASEPAVLTDLAIHGIVVETKNVKHEVSTLLDVKIDKYSGPCYSIDKATHRVYSAFFTMTFVLNGRMTLTVTYDPTQIFDYTAVPADPNLGTVSPANLTSK